MKKLLLALLPVISYAQPSGYWQQQVHYQMNIDFDVEKHQFEGEQELTYTNNSPDTITQVFYHLYFNAFQPGSMMDVRAQNVPDPDKRIGDRIGNLSEEEQGYHRINRLTQEGKELSYHINQTILQAQLREPLPPGGSTLLQMKFNSQVPVQIRRSGRNNEEGIDYTMTQWYPKLAAYDQHGWHADPYVFREYYGDYGSFDISIEIESQYKLGGTGELQNPEAYWQEGEEFQDFTEMTYQAGKKERRTWRFKAENVHDFAWAADEDYVRLRSQGPDDLELNFYYLPKYKKTWRELPGHTIQFFDLMNKQFGQYAYPQFSVMQGGDGGMEYPMCTMLKGSGKLKDLVGVMAHEAAHSWYYGMLGSNENQYPWMDEGFTSFAEDEVLDKMRENFAPNPHLGSYANYYFMVQKEELVPMSTPADYFSRNRSYGISSYSRGAIFLNQLRVIVGKKDFDRGMKEYYRQWRFKHPDPWDFLRVMEEVSGLQLDWYLNFWVNTTKTIDYGVTDVKPLGKETSVVSLERKGEMPIAIEVTVFYKTGGEQTFFVPLVSMHGTKNSQMVSPADPWPWTHPTYQLEITAPYENIQKVIIDRHNELADVNRTNNEFVVSEGGEE